MQWRKMAHTGTMPLLGMVRFVVIADSDQEARALGAPAYKRWLATLLHLWRRSGVSAPYNLPGTLEGAIAAGLGAVGTSATVQDALRGQIDEAGVNYVMCHLAFGDLPLTASLRTVAALKADIIPAL
jgi:alkanesulfonate monooxygenase SsuD/methylene tetrahydromethanopterin reductase-like flavin-dependent oxidoreductase (luciferase family)